MIVALADLPAPTSTITRTSGVGQGAPAHRIRERRARRRTQALSLSLAPPAGTASEEAAVPPSGAELRRRLRDRQVAACGCWTRPSRLSASFWANLVNLLKSEQIVVDGPAKHRYPA